MLRLRINDNNKSPNPPKTKTNRATSPLGIGSSWKREFSVSDGDSVLRDVNPGPLILLANSSEKEYPAAPIIGEAHPVDGNTGSNGNSAVPFAKSSDNNLGALPKVKKGKIASFKEYADLYDKIVEEVLGQTETQLKTMGCSNCDRVSLERVRDLEKYAIEASISRLLEFTLKCPNCNVPGNKHHDGCMWRP